MTNARRIEAVMAAALLLALGGCQCAPPSATDSGQPEVDAGATQADSGATVADSGLPDAGPTSVDAGQPDSGLADAGPPDSGRDDAGPSDSGLADGGAVDAGTPVDSGTTLPVDAGRFIYVGSGDVDAGTTELRITEQRRFECDPSAVSSAGAVLASMTGTAGEDLVITPASSPCSFNLLHRMAGVDAPLSTQPGGYLVTAGVRFPDGVRLVCASDIAHHPVFGDPVNRDTDAVAIRCWASSTTAFTATVVAVPSDPSSAAWVRALKPHPSASGVYLVDWAHDFSFQVFNMSDQGRPPSDGIYETTLTFNGSTLVASTTTRLSAVTNPFAGESLQPWVPTGAERAALGGFIPFDDAGVSDAGP